MASEYIQGIEVGILVGMVIMFLGIMMIGVAQVVDPIKCMMCALT